MDLDPHVNRYVLALVAGLAYLACRALYNVFLHPLHTFPGPRVASASKLWIWRNNWYMRGAYELASAHERYGPVVRCAPNTLSFADPAALRDIFSHGPTFIKSDFYEARKAYQEDHMFSLINQTSHAARRRLASRAFAMQSMLAFENTLNEKVGLLMDSWAKRIEPGRPLDVFYWCHWLGFEAMMQLAFDEDVKIVGTGIAHPVTAWLRQWKPATVYRQIFGDWLNYYGHWFPGSMGQIFRDLRKWKAFAMESVLRARKSNTETVYLSKIMREKDASTGQPLDDNQLAEEAMGLIFGGSGTTANTLICLLWAVLSNADIKSRLEAELRGVEDSSETGLLPYATTSKLPYLNAVLNETLRRYPGIIGSQQRIATVDTVVAGVPVPKNTVCLTANWVTHRSDYFPHADDFDPSRWLDEKAERLKESFNPFGIGPRACIGQNLAIMELLQATAAFFRRFDATVDPSMHESLFIQNDTFNGQPRGGKLLLHLIDRAREKVS